MVLVTAMEYLPSLQQEIDELKPSLFGKLAKTAASRNPSGSRAAKLTKYSITQSFLQSNSFRRFSPPRYGIFSPSRPIAILATSYGS